MTSYPQLWDFPNQRVTREHQFLLKISLACISDKSNAGKMLSRRHLRRAFTTAIFLCACSSLCEEAQKPKQPVADDTSGDRTKIEPEDLCIL